MYKWIAYSCDSYICLRIYFIGDSQTLIDITYLFIIGLLLAYWPSSLSTIKPINHQAYRPSSLSTIKPFDHWAYRPSSLSTIKPIDHQSHWPSSLLTLALLSRLLCLLACWKYILSISKTRQNIEFQTSSPVSPNKLNIDLVKTSRAPCSISSLHCIVIEYHNHKSDFSS